MRTILWLQLAAAWMALVGLFRGAGGLMLILKKNELPTPVPITASSDLVILGGTTLLTVCLVLIWAAIRLWQLPHHKTWVVSRWALILFLAGGLMNSYLLFGEPQLHGQSINFIAAVIPCIFLYLGRPALSDT